MNRDIQDSLVKAVDIIVKENINNTQYTASIIAIVKSVKGFDAVVEIQGEECKCILLEHLHDWIQPNDIVILQDLYNDSRKRAIIGKVGTSAPTSFTVFDEGKKRAISGVEQLYDDELQREVDILLDIE